MTIFPAFQPDAESFRERDSDNSDSSALSDMWSISSSNSSLDEDDEDRLRLALRKIFIVDNMNPITLTKILLYIYALKPMHPSLPLEARTLLGTPVVHNIQQMGKAMEKYCHLGIEKGFTGFTSYSSDALHLLFNIDGLPVTKGNQQN